MLAQLSSAISSTGDARGGIGVIGVLAIVVGIVLVLTSGALWLRRRPHGAASTRARLDERDSPGDGARSEPEDRCG